MRTCRRCDGFVPPSLGHCPHCEVSLAPRAGMSLRGKIATSVMVSSAAVTLMACYGAPCVGDDGACFPDLSTGTEGTDGGLEQEACDPGSPTTVIAPSEFPAVVEGSLPANSGTNNGSCGGVGSELVYEWTPPAPGSYRLSVSSGVDTVLYLRDASGAGACGVELGCNDDQEDQDPELELELDGAPVRIVVDAYDQQGAGDFSLSIEALDSP